ncbi:histidine phosphatase family protein [Nocardioides sp. ChNu-153]|uniref:histidine phosphatase family protein n=1 Tax=unclassified Nocardioides TaxID=2615069 RepID=UPI002404F65D|nr:MULTISPECIES: histidine phosphatase family protein [unclassified Nocardioides]MDF9717439.1 histidine phosphatase family protein [Nocardioides sp. ChNu-99]MDN7120855.1 histidine phosphatase family protein [Nocardioides sp. ChNu-153]
MAILIVRHGETEWSRDGRHTSVTDLPLTPVGEEQARALAPRLAERDVALALTSPRARARRTAAIVGFGAAEVDERLVEWDYGDLEGRTTPEVREDLPGWTVWTGDVPGGETAAQVGARCDAVLADVVARVDVRERDVLLVAHGHLLRVLAARWLGLPPDHGRLLRLDTARLTELGHEREQQVLLRWNA